MALDVKGHFFVAGHPNDPAFCARCGEVRNWHLSPIPIPPKANPRGNKE